jgi:YesN/AraC family two-component response regulator
LGAVEYLTKPIERDELNRVLKKYLVIWQFEITATGYFLEYSVFSSKLRPHHHYEQIKKNGCPGARRCRCFR